MNQLVQLKNKNGNVYPLTNAQCSLAKNSGYVKFDNGFLLQWKNLTVNAGGTQWGSIYYSDHDMGKWGISFKALFFSIPAVNSNLFWVTHENTANLEYAGNIRCFRATSAVADASITIVGFGTWK